MSANSFTNDPEKPPTNTPAKQAGDVGDGAISQGDHNITIGERGVYAGNVSGDIVTGTKIVQNVTYQQPPLPFIFQAPPLPEHFVKRPEAKESLLNLVLRSQETPGALVISAVQGLGGIGKTTLVADLARDPQMLARYPDGVLWATLGQTPELINLLHAWIRALGDYRYNPLTPDDATAHLRSLLTEKACLLVVDDAWNTDHVRPFLAGSDRCQVLITTRDATLAKKVHAQLYDLDVMNEAQALRLFEARLGDLGQHHLDAQALAKELGYLPLALELATAQIADGKTWPKLLAAFRKGLADLDTLSLDEAAQRNESLRLSFKLSLEQLTSAEQESFAWLGVLPEDAQLNPQMAATLWQLPAEDAARRLQRFRNKALLKTVGEERYTAHDLIYHEARLHLIGRMTIVQAHVTLLHHYYLLCQPNPQGPSSTLSDTWGRARHWHTLPDDGYIHDYLTWHFQQSEQSHLLFNLLDETTPDGKNGWYEKCKNNSRIAQYLNDVDQAWKIARGNKNIPEQIRCALMQVSVRSIIENYPLALYVSILKHHSTMLSAKTMLGVVRQRSRAWQKADAVYDLSPYLPSDVLPEAVDIAISVASLNERGILGLARYLPAELILEAFLRLPGHAQENKQVWFLERVAPVLPDGLLDAAVQFAKNLEGFEYRSIGLACVFQRVAPNHPQILQEAIACLGQVRNRYLGSRALLYLYPYLTPDQIDASWELIDLNDPEPNREGSMWHNWLFEAGLPSWMACAIEAIPADSYLEIFEKIVRICSREQLASLITALPCQPGEWLFWSDVAALGILADHLDSSMQEQLVVRILDSNNEDFQLVALGHVNSHLSSPQIAHKKLEDLLANIVSESTYGVFRAVQNAYRAVVELLPRDIVLSFVLRLRENLHITDWTPVVIDSLASLPGELCQDIIQEIISNENVELKVNQKIQLAEYFGATDRDQRYTQLLETVEMIHDQDDVYCEPVPYEAFVNRRWGRGSNDIYWREVDHVRVFLNMVLNAQYPLLWKDGMLQALRFLAPDHPNACLDIVVQLIHLFPRKTQKRFDEQIIQYLDKKLPTKPEKSSEIYPKTLYFLLEHPDISINKIALDHSARLDGGFSSKVKKILYRIFCVCNKLSEEQAWSWVKELETIAHDMAGAKFLEEQKISARLRLLNLLFDQGSHWLDIRDYFGIDEDGFDSPPPEISAERRADLENDFIDDPRHLLDLMILIACLPMPYKGQIRSSIKGYFEKTPSSKIEERNLYFYVPWIPNDLFVCIMEKFLTESGTTREIPGGLEHEVYKGLAMFWIEIGSQWAKLDPSSAYALFEKYLPFWARGDRQLLLLYLHAVAPVMVKLGGEDAVHDILEEIRRVNFWWP